MRPTLRQRLIGAWRLVSYVERDVDTGEEDWPLGKTPEGIIMYTPDGYMSAQLCKSGRRNFAGGDMYKASAEEYMAAGSTYMAYSGPFYVDESRRLLQHEMSVSLFPNWKGQRQIRLVEIDEDVLHLATETPMRFAGGCKIASLRWKRVPAND